jgi:hypothetical protein
MALSNELSSEIAAALLSPPNRSPRELKDLQEVVFRIHSVLSQMNEAQQSRHNSGAGSEQENSTASAAGGS